MGRGGNDGRGERLAIAQGALLRWSSHDPTADARLDDAAREFEALAREADRGEAERRDLDMQRLACLTVLGRVGLASSLAAGLVGPATRGERVVIGCLCPEVATACMGGMADGDAATLLALGHEAGGAPDLDAFDAAAARLLPELDAWESALLGHARSAVEARHLRGTVSPAVMGVA